MRFTYANDATGVSRAFDNLGDALTFLDSLPWGDRGTWVVYG